MFENDCGTTVVISVFKYFRINLNYVEVKKALNNNSEGTNIFNLKNFFISAGITSKIHKVPKEHKINMLDNTNEKEYWIKNYLSFNNFDEVLSNIGQ